MALTKEQISQLQGSMLDDPFASEYYRGEYYVLKINDVYQLLTPRDTYQVFERQKNGMNMFLEYVGKTDGKAFTEDQDVERSNTIDLEMKKCLEQINKFPNMDIIPKDAPIRKDVEDLWNKYYELMKEKSRIEKDISAKDPAEALKKEVAKAKKWTKAIVARAKKERWGQKRLNQELYPEASNYEVFTPKSNDEQRDFILNNLPK